MPRRKTKENDIRKLTRVGRSSLSVIIPSEIVEKLKLRERQKVIVRLSGERIVIEDWEKWGEKGTWPLFSSYNYTIPDGSGIAIPGINGKPVFVENLQFNYEVVEKYFLGKVKLIDTVGIYDVKEKSYKTKNLLTESINPYEVEKVWQEIESPLNVLDKVTFGIAMESAYPEI